MLAPCSKSLPRLLLCWLLRLLSLYTQLCCLLLWLLSAAAALKYLPKVPTSLFLVLLLLAALCCCCWPALAAAAFFCHVSFNPPPPPPVHARTSERIDSFIHSHQRIRWIWVSYDNYLIGVLVVMLEVQLPILHNQIQQRKFKFRHYHC